MNSALPGIHFFPKTLLNPTAKIQRHLESPADGSRFILIVKAPTSPANKLKGLTNNFSDLFNMIYRSKRQHFYLKDLT